MGNDNSFRPKPAHSGNLIADVLIDTAINAIPITNAVHSAYRNRDHHQTQDYRTQTQSTRLTPPIKGPSDKSEVKIRFLSKHR